MDRGSARSPRAVPVRARATPAILVLPVLERSGYLQGLRRRDRESHAWPISLNETN